MNTYSEIERKRLLAIIGQGNELQSIACAKIYTAGKDADYWLYSDLEGFLCYMLHKEDKTRYLCLYDTETYELLFKFELYKDFEKFYTSITDVFHCFEVNNGFIGLKFYDISEAKLFSVIVMKFNDEISKMLLSINTTKKQGLNTQKSNEMIQIFKKKLIEDIVSKQDFNDDYIEEELDIVKPRQFELLNNIIFDREKQRFVIGEISNDLKKIFQKNGVKKSDFEDKGFALMIVKHFMMSYDNCQKGIKNGTIMIKKKKSEGFAFHDIVDNTIVKKSVVNKEYSEDSKSNAVQSEINYKNDGFKQENISKGDNQINVNDKKSITPTPINNTVIVPKIPSIPVSSVPNVPNITISSIPKIPSIPSINSIPSIPNVPPIPKVYLYFNLG